MCSDQRVAKLLEFFFSDFEDHGHETWLHKSRQVFGSWGACTFVTASLIAIPGFRAAAQSRKESVSMELVARVRYQLEHASGPLEGAVELERPHPTMGVKVKSVFGQEVNSYFMGLGEGAEQWRFEQLTLGILDEITYNRQAKRAYAAQQACVEGGGKTIVIFTGKYGTFGNEEAEKIIERANG